VRASVGGGARSLSTMRHRRFQPVVFLVFSRGCQLPARGGTPQKRAKVLAFYLSDSGRKIDVWLAGKNSEFSMTALPDPKRRDRPRQTQNGETFSPGPLSPFWVSPFWISPFGGAAVTKI